MESLSALCFLCNEETLCFGARLVSSRIPLTETTLASKIELLLGDNFMIVVGQDDKLCNRCYKMVIKFNKLEADLVAIRKSIQGFLNVKYNLENYSDNVDPGNAFPSSDELSVSLDNKVLEEGESVIPSNTEDLEILSDANPPTKYGCSVCSFKSANQATTLAHLRTVHKSTVVYKCATCDKRFASRSKVQQHIVIAHGALADKVNTGSKAVRYRCGLCSQTYPSQSELVDHFRVHREEEVIVPDQVEITEMRQTENVSISEIELPDLGLLQRFKNELGLAGDEEDIDFTPLLPSEQISSQSQLREILPKPPTELHECSECGLRGFNENDMRLHLADVHGRRYQCQLCSQMLASRSSLQRHLERHSLAPVMCRQCCATLPDKLHLRVHMLQEHPQDFRCLACNLSFPTAALLRTHEATHGEERPTPPKYFCNECGKEFSTGNSLRRHSVLHDRSPSALTCTVCEQTCADKVSLRSHQLKAHGVSSRRSTGHGVSCDKCIKVFPTQRRLQRHKELVHRPPGCRHCGKEIVPVRKLIAHERRHESTATFPCPTCPKIFKTVTGLRIHSAVHTGQYRFVCAVCGKGFNTVAVHDEHMATHTKEALYTCERCGRGFSSKSTLRLHRIWHDNPFPYKCNLCQRKFRHTSLLSVHKRRVHTGERPYSCPHCPLTFSVSGSRNKHVVLHTRKFPHRCKTCGKGVTTRTKLARHMARVHDDFTMVNAKPAPCEYKMVLRPEEQAVEAVSDDGANFEFGLID